MSLEITVPRLPFAALGITRRLQEALLDTTLQRFNDLRFNEAEPFVI